MAENDLKTWVSDKLMSLMGYSQRTVVNFVIGLSKSATSPADAMSKLIEHGFSSSAETRLFAEEIFARVPRKASGLNSYQKAEKEAAMLAKKQKTYDLIYADDDHEDNGGRVSPVAVQSKKSVSGRKRLRKKIESNDSDDEEVISKGEQERRVQRRTSPEYEEEDDLESEAARIRDQEERAQLERNIRERDATATRKLMEPKLSRKQEEEAIRRSNAMEDTSILRKFSRQEYLKKREQKKFEELRDDIEDEQYLFGNVKLTEAEEHEMRYKKEIFELAKKLKSEDVDSINEYKMPEAYDQEGGINQEKRFAAPLQRYRDTGVEDKMNPFAEQEAWEEHQIGKATLKFGSKDKKQMSDDYQYVFEDQIEFVKASVMDGHKYEDELPSKVPEDSVEKSMLQKLKDERKTLPIYPYREELLQAISDHQISVAGGAYTIFLLWVNSLTQKGSCNCWRDWLWQDYSDTPVSS